ncbi:uncharacterized protein LOC122508698 isoform X2 [Leptopilina heterotoma]|nr:uncharacterized protein LOC122508698 isoform X2 [Leptopilina heterotoma]
MDEDERQKRKRQKANSRQRKRRARQKLWRENAELQRAREEDENITSEGSSDESVHPLSGNDFKNLKTAPQNIQSDIPETQNIPSIDVESKNENSDSTNKSENDNSSNFNDSENESVFDISDTNEDESSSEEFTFASEVDALRDWAIDCSISQSHLDKLLSILRRRLLPDLPKSSKTFLRTSSSSYDIKNIKDSLGNDADFVYLGIEKGLKARINEDLVKDTIELVINMDGMPLNKSGVNQFWPILVQIFSKDEVHEPFPVAIFHGNAKPNLDEFLDDFITEINQLLKEGIEISEGRKINICIKCFICDTPARNYIKATIGHGGYYCCERCTVKGDRFKMIEEDGVIKKVHLQRTVYPETKCAERTDDSFRKMEQKEHHHKTSPITRISPPVDMIFSFLLDFMHLCCLGVMKRMLEWWLINKATKLSGNFRNELGRRMELLKYQVPSEFKRKPRSTKFYAKWKATEYRFFLLYCGPIVLKKILSTAMYKHFLLLHVSCRILCCVKLCTRFTNYAKEFLIRFFESLPIFYGSKSQILNFHNLIHLSDDVHNMNCSLNHVTAFPFENLLGKIKRRLLRTSVRPLAQVCRRLHEEDMQQISKKPIALKNFEILETKNDEILKINYQKYEISTKSPNNIVLLTNDVVLNIEKIFKVNNEYKISGLEYEKKKSLFEYPVDSKHLKMWEVESGLMSNKYTFPLELIDSKLVKISVNYKENDNYRHYVMPLLH